MSDWWTIIKYKDVVKPTLLDRVRRWDFEAGQKFYESDSYQKLLQALLKLSNMKYTPQRFKMLASMAFAEMKKEGNLDAATEQHEQNEIKAILDKLETAWNVETNKTLSRYWPKILEWFGI